ncbi:MAG: MBL fold metallo-hydrolase [Phycisphaerales bacterium]|nr:MBL fold metallo-hydrolase [Phycisphaerales bacterium]
MPNTPQPLLDTSTRYRWEILRAGAFRLDGGSMFGLIPRVVWERTAKPDERGRIEVQHNCLLLERIGDGSGPKLVLIEVGTGDKLDPKSRDIFAMSTRWIGDALQEKNCRCEDIGAVVTTHLHFDHAGALTRLARAGEKADWTGAASCFAGSRGEHGVKLTFPNAALHTQAREWSDAIANRSVMTRTYFRDHLELIRERLVLADSPRPFPTGHVPGRDELPLAPVYNRVSTLAGLPGVGVFLAPGHTWGQQAITFIDDKGRTIVFTPDVMPTAWHLGAAYSLGYDVEPYTSMVTRHWFLRAACEGGWLLVLDHEPGNPCRRVKEAGAWFELVEDGR